MTAIRRLTPARPGSTRRRADRSPSAASRHVATPAQIILICSLPFAVFVSPGTGVLLGLKYIVTTTALYGFWAIVSAVATVALVVPLGCDEQLADIHAAGNFTTVDDSKWVCPEAKEFLTASSVAALVIAIGLAAHLLVAGGLLDQTDASALTTKEVFGFVSAGTPLRKTTTVNDFAEAIDAPGRCELLGAVERLVCCPLRLSERLTRDPLSLGVRVEHLPPLSELTRARAPAGGCACRRELAPRSRPRSPRGLEICSYGVRLSSAHSLEDQDPLQRQWVQKRKLPHQHLFTRFIDPSPS